MDNVLALIALACRLSFVSNSNIAENQLVLSTFLELIHPIPIKADTHMLTVRAGQYSHLFFGHLVTAVEDICTVDARQIVKCSEFVTERRAC